MKIWNQLRGRFFRWSMLLPVFGVLCPVVSTIALSEVQISSHGDFVRIDARDAPLAEVLEALRAASKLSYSASTELTQPLTGIFEGPLPFVISRVLKGYNYVIKSSNEKFEIFIYVTNKATVPVADSAPPKRVLGTSTTSPGSLEVIE